MQLQMQTRLHGKGFMEKLLVEGFLRLVHEDARDTGVVELWAPRTAHHLEHIGDRHVYVLALLRIEIFGTFDNHQVARQVDTPCEDVKRDKALKCHK